MSQPVDLALPRWARAVDVTALACVAVGVSVFITGGFRETTPFGRLSVTSASRPIAIAAALFLLRHWCYRDPSLLARARAHVDGWRRSAAWRVVWPVFLSTRLGVLVVGFLGIALLGYAPNTPPWRIYDNDLLNMPARWDTGWYLAIADTGYAWGPRLATDMQNVAFFPAFPIAMHYTSLLVGRHTVWAGVLVSLVAFLFALLYLFRFARDKIGEERAAAAVALLAAYPFAIFYSAAYTEGLFLLAALATCYHYERNQLGQAAMWGLLAGLTRPNGCLLSVVLAAIAFRDLRATSWTTTIRRIAIAAMPGAGMLLFSAYMYVLTGNALAWAVNHAAYGRVYRGLGDLIVDRILYIQANGLYNYVTVLSLDVMNAIPIMFALAAVWPVSRLLGMPYALMIVINVALPVLMGGVLSMGRMTAVLFPIFIWLGAAVPERHRTAWIVAFAMVQALCAIAFFTWRPLV